MPEKDPPVSQPPAASDCAIDDSDDGDESYVEAQRIRSEQKQKRPQTDSLRVQEIFPVHFSPLVQPLTSSSVESCVVLENAAFPNPDHRATREKFEYRLSTCSDICSGIFCSIVPSEAKDKDFALETLPVANPVETGRANGAVLALCAHVVSTLGNGPVVTDADMSYPVNWRDQESSKSSGLGHQVMGRTVCLHSFAVAPKLQGCGLGKLMMKSYLQQINNSGVADRVALICQDQYLVSYYKRFGFRHVGESRASFAGGGWNDMVIDLAGPPKKSTEALKAVADETRAHEAK
ncbi:Polyamine N-acetyltransferase 1 [Colletotrichum sp. SAR 10_70]|nr:Polyamine N-acetyltransferase 1 [Colletotrichum sp. SAR 10_71]KAI8166301.1 Polyamine N-acetyltransferase 1 [Colletotrichum sp. SAR 10_65]KAI8171545.1 Polyamine N-acetyltransferase 1 [Colletotrichum sp. SAR 10_70]KAI8184911.1 Polyamine N-acetyltransferase 1 [Colletotrichum sp. SAR 10_75]KAI8201723.1 Polyamine N-acetyltransferase 1 [Colletotrichum sp. SAR 10_76]KAI8222578.1 Polyamine N-acetyltransferase 1 [Colletotrichum sp. SAR 10_86]KAI8223294.1 Polyamine N-acetyltransferase 1 [Colletotric